MRLQAERKSSGEIRRFCEEVCNRVSCTLQLLNGIYILPLEFHLGEHCSRNIQPSKRFSLIPYIYRFYPAALQIIVAIHQYQQRKH